MAKCAMNERIVIEGGPLDGTIGEIGPECSRLGFFVHQEGEWDDPKSIMWGYFAHGYIDGGVRVFRPGKPQ